MATPFPLPAIANEAAGLFVAGAIDSGIRLVFAGLRAQLVTAGQYSIQSDPADAFRWRFFRGATVLFSCQTLVELVDECKGLLPELPAGPVWLIVEDLDDFLRAKNDQVMCDFALWAGAKFPLSPLLGASLCYTLSLHFGDRLQALAELCRYRLLLRGEPAAAAWFPELTEPQELQNLQGLLCATYQETRLIELESLAKQLTWQVTAARLSDGVREAAGHAIAATAEQARVFAGFRLGGSHDPVSIEVFQPA